MELIELAREAMHIPIDDPTSPTPRTNPAWAQSKGKVHFYYSIRTGSHTGSDDAEADNYQPLVYFEMSFECISAHGYGKLQLRIYPVSC